MLRIVEVVPYNTAWSGMFAIEAAIIEERLGSNCLAVYHIGSTAIPNLSAKPVIDIMAVVKDITKVDDSNFIPLGYTPKGEMGMPFRNYMSKGKPQHTYHLHIWEENNAEVKKHLLFKQHLLNDKNDREAYAALKNKLALNFREQHSEYTTRKDSFIKQIIQKTGFDGFIIVQAMHAKEWQEYHRIKRTQIFDRLPNIAYNPEHPDLKAPNHLHFVLSKGVEIIAIMHIEMCNDYAIIRGLATDEPYQNQGIGSYFMGQMERWLKLHGHKLIHLHAARCAENFYRRLNYIDMPFADKGINPDNIDMGKYL